MAAEVKVDTDFSHLLRNCEAAQAALAEEVLQDCTPLVPKDTGALRRSGHVSGRDEVTWSEDYADFVYSGTSRMEPRPWFEDAKAANLGRWKRVVGEVLNRG